MKRLVIVSQELGTYIGTALEKPQWSNEHPTGYLAAMTFANADEAIKHVKRWPKVPPGLRVVPVHCQSRFSTIGEMRAAGLPGWESGSPYQYGEGI